jgi:SnoaL-like domain
MDDGNAAALLREMKDRQEIYDCLMRYCRGIDRLDRELLLSAYHPDAADDHGTFVGKVEGFADYAFDLHTRYQLRTQHHITNHICEIDGDVAHAESYYIFRSLNTQAPLHTTASGRYLDRLERRNGRWAIADRICLVDIRNDHWAPTGTEGDADYMPNYRNRTDTSYQRPIRVDRSRFT